ncbi:MAG: PIN domain-containing protein [Patescibacteria group bacterium]
MMQVIGIDTNALLEYFLARANKSKIESVIKKCINNEVMIYVALPVFLELEWVLRSYYKINKKEVINILQSLFEMNKLITDDKPLLLMSIELFEKDNSMSFTDCVIFNLNRKNHVSKLLTFDKKFEKKFVVE